MTQTKKLIHSKKEKEIWRDVKDTYGLYEVSNLGNIARKNLVYPDLRKTLAQSKNKKGVSVVTFSIQGQKKVVRVARIVACAFLGDKPFEVHHKDGNKSNNSAENLFYLEKEKLY